MKVLFDCFSCSPYYGSDEGIGWLWPYYMRKYHDVWVLVRKDRKADIERFCEDNNITDIHFIYADVPDWMNFYYKNKEKGQNRVLDFLLYQFLWQYPAYVEAKKVHKVVNFDLIHHVATNDFRLLGRLHYLNVPLIIGPIGGAQETPKSLEYYIRNHKKSEIFRSGLNRIMISIPGYRKSINRAKRVYFSNIETKEFLANILHDKQKGYLMTEVGCSETSVSIETKEREKRKTCFMWAGRMEYRKGLELLFDALELLPQNLEWELVLCGAGIEFENYKRLVLGKKLEEHIRFVGWITHAEVLQYYRSADVFVFPSLRETTGTVIIDAMANGVPVIALRQGGAVQILDSECGVLISVDTKEQCINDLSHALENFILNPHLSRQMGKAAKQKILDQYIWEYRIEEMAKEYQKIVLE